MLRWLLVMICLESVGSGLMFVRSVFFNVD